MPTTTRSELAQELINLGESAPASLARTLQDILPEIENALSKGVAARTIVQMLGNKGINISLKTFHGTLYRLRKRMKVRPVVPDLASGQKMKEESLPVPQISGVKPNIETVQQNGMKTLKQLRAENPAMDAIQLAKMQAEQYRSSEWKYTG